MRVNSEGVRCKMERCRTFYFQTCVFLKKLRQIKEKIIFERGRYTSHIDNTDGL